MNVAPLLAKALRDLDKSMQDSLNGTQLESIKETISNYAIAATVASAVAGVIPGIAGVAAALTQTGFVWATYVKINKTLGISMSENTTKFIGSAIITNLVTNCGVLLLAYATACVAAFIPGVGMAVNAILGYIIVYVSAIIYLKLITQLMQPDGTLHVEESDDTKHIIHEIIQTSNIKDIMNEGKNAYKQAKENGDIDRAKNNPTCPNCGASTRPGQKFCSECGTRIE